MDNEKSGISIKTFQFLIRHPWFFIWPAVVIGTIAFSSSKLMVDDYMCSAVLSFGSASGSIVEKAYQTRDDLFSKILVGDGIKTIISNTWPDIDEDKDPGEYAKLVSKLRDPSNGLIIKYGKTAQNTVNISFINQNPTICYKVVTAAVNYILKEGKRAGELKIEAGVGFLRKQLEFYKDKLKNIDENLSILKIKLRSISGDMSEDERMLIDEITSDSPIQGKQELAVQKSAKYEEILAGLELQLLDAEKRYAILKRRLENKDFSADPATSETVNDDSMVRDYTANIAAKQLAVAELMAKGYTTEHPDVSKTLKNIKDLNEIKNKRIEELTGGAFSEMSESSKKIAEQNLRTSINDLEANIVTLKEKVGMMKKRQQSSENSLNPAGSRFTNLSADASRLVELRNEKEVNTEYYMSTRKQLEEALLKARIEESGAGYIINVIEAPKEPKTPMPLKKFTAIIMGILMGLGSGAGLAYVVDMLDKSIKSSSELRDAFKLPVLASIERINTAHEVEANNKRIVINGISLLTFVVLSMVVMNVIIFMRTK